MLQNTIVLKRTTGAKAKGQYFIKQCTKKQQHTITHKWGPHVKRMTPITYPGAIHNVR